MIGEIKKTLKHSIIYAFGNISVKLIGLLLIPLYTDPQYLSTKQFGLHAILEATSQIIIGILGLSMIQNLSRWYWDQKYKENQKEVFFTALMFLIGLTSLFILFSVSVTPTIVSWYFEDTLSTHLLRLVLFVSALQVINTFILGFARVTIKSTFYSLMIISKFSITFLLIIWLLVYEGKSIAGIWEASLYAECAILIPLMVFAKRNITYKFNTTILKEMLAYGTPLSLAAIFTVMLSVIDRYMLGLLSGLDNVAIYSLGYRISNALKIVISTSLMFVVSPLKMKLMNTKKADRFYSKSYLYSAYIFSFFLIGLSLISTELLKMLTKSNQYWEASSIIPIIGFALLFGLLKDNLVIGLSISKKTKVYGLIIILISLLNVGLNYLFIPLWGIYGASYATLFSQILFFLAIYYKAQQSYHIGYENKKVFLIIIVAFAIVIGGRQIQFLNLELRLLIKGICVLLFPIILYFFNFYEKVELEKIKKIIFQISQPGKFIKNYRAKNKK